MSISVAEIGTENIVIKPNPVQDILTVSNLTGGGIIQIFSIQGKEIIRLQPSGNEVKVNMSQCAPGIYLLKIGDKVTKIIKK